MYLLPLVLMSRYAPICVAIDKAIFLCSITLIDNREREAAQHSNSGGGALRLGRLGEAHMFEKTFTDFILSLNLVSKIL